MISIDYVRTFARYNRWQNQSIFSAAGTLSDAERKQMRGAFFGSVHATLNHLLWGDRMWMSRLSDWPRPGPQTIAQSTEYFAEWAELARERATTDASILAWAHALEPDWLAGDMTYYSGASGREITRPRWLLVAHLFNHQTHHRGQAHCLLTELGAKPDDTDLPFMPQ